MNPARLPLSSQLETWATLNLRLGWTPEQALQLQLDGINLLDQAYREHGSGIDGKGVGLVVGANYRF